MHRKGGLSFLIRIFRVVVQSAKFVDGNNLLEAVDSTLAWVSSLPGWSLKSGAPWLHVEARLCNSTIFLISNSVPKNHDSCI